MTRRVAITGVGLVTPLGLDAEATWHGLLEGRSGVGAISQFDAAGCQTRIAAEVKGFEPSRYLSAADVRATDRFQQLALAAAQMALRDAGLPARFEGELAERSGCYLGTGIGGLTTLQRAFESVAKKGPRHGSSAYFLPAIIANLGSGRVSMAHQLKGPSLTHSTACASGAHAVGEAMRVIQHHGAEVMLAGGSEACINQLCVAGFNALQALSLRNDAPERASRPFDAGRDGFVLGEGAGLLVLEELEHARRRGARVYAELTGYALTSDAHHPTAPSLDGPVRCMALALRDARRSPADIGYVNAHGTSTRFNDLNETQAIKQVFGAHAPRLAISSIKSALGHSLGASGGVELALSALALARGVLPPTLNLEQPDPQCDLDYLPGRPREQAVGALLKNSFAFGGVNASLVMERV